MKDETPLEFGFVDDIDEDGGTIRVPYGDEIYVFFKEDLPSDLTLQTGQSVQFIKNDSEYLDFIADKVEKSDFKKAK